MEVPTISLESPVPTPSPQPSPPPSPPPPQPSNPPAPLSTSTPLTFPNLTPINLSTNNNKNSGRHSPRHSTSSDSAMTLSLSSSVLTKDTGSLASSESSPEPTPLSKETFPDSFVPKSSSPPSLPSPPPRKVSPKTIATSAPAAAVPQDVSPPEPPQQKEILPDKLVSQDSSSTLKPAPYIRSTSVNETASVPSSGTTKTDQSLKAPVPKSRSLSTSAAPKVVEKSVFSFPSKESSIKKGSALAALASATSKLPFVETEDVPSSPAYKTSFAELTFPAPKSPPYSNGVDDPVPPTPSTPSASVCSVGSGSGTPSGPATPLDSSCGPSPAPTSRSSHGTPGLAERPGATVVRSGSLHEKPTAQPVIDEWERKLYGRNASE